MAVVQYSPLPPKEQEDQHDTVNFADEPRHSSSFSSPSRFYVILLCLSVILNVYQFGTSHARTSSILPETSLEEDGIARNDYGSKPSYLMGLTQNITTVFASSSGVHGNGEHDKSAADEIWETPSFEPNRNFVAVDHEWAAAKGLPPAQPWPWDKTKGIYVIHGMHLLHCTKAIYQTFDQIQTGKPRTWSWVHLEHCAHMLREEIMCSANDNLIYTGRMAGQEDIDVPVPGLGQPRMCRDWSHLLDWATERSACYKNIPSTGEGFRESERYKFCPDGKEYW